MKTKNLVIPLYEVGDRVETPIGPGEITETPTIESIPDYLHKTYKIALDNAPLGFDTYDYTTDYLTLILL